MYDYFVRSIVWWLFMVVLCLAVVDPIGLVISLACLALNLLAAVLRWWDKKWSF